MLIAFYKGTRPGLAGLYSRAVRWWTKGKYSHVEVIFTDGLAASASFLDGGVRFKAIKFDDGKWDFVNVPDRLEPAARKWFKRHSGQGYDVLGNVHFIISLVSGEKRKWFCSEAVAAALGFIEPWRFEPNTLAAVLKSKPPMSGFFNDQKKG